LQMHRAYAADRIANGDAPGGLEFSLRHRPLLKQMKQRTR